MKFNAPNLSVNFGNVRSGLLDVRIIDATWAMPTTPTIFAPDEISSSTDAIDYDLSTGEITFNRSQAYNMIISLNPSTTSAMAIYRIARKTSPFRARMNSATAKPF